jgi:hypothetical protein
MDWLLYTSLDSLTLAGDWLIAAIKRAWPHEDRHTWVEGDYERPTSEDG